LSEEEYPLKRYETGTEEQHISSDSAEKSVREVEQDEASVEDVEGSSVAFTSEIEEEDIEEVDRPPRRKFFPPDREQILNWAPFWGVILLGAILRFWGLGDKPLHHDESLHAYFSLQLMHNMENWLGCFTGALSCYHYDPLLHGPFQFHAIALVYKVSQLLGVYDHGVNTVTVRIAAATLGTVIVGLPYFLRDYLGKTGAWLACFLLAISPSMVYFSRFAREDIYMACFTLLLVVAVARYVRSREIRWLIIAAVAFALSYATKEATFLSIAVFGSFLGALLAWELGVRRQWNFWERVEGPLARYKPKTWAPFAVLLYFVIAAPFAGLFFSAMKRLSIYITDPKNTAVADAYVQGLKDRTTGVVPWIGILLGIYVLSILIREMMGKLPLPGQNAVARRLDPERQPLLNSIFTMPWTHWFFALLCGWAIFLVLFTVLFTNLRGGIGDGIWQGLYYWLQQQQVARGEQPWYYYLLLIPLYEQIGLVFGIVGIVRSLLRPTRLRLFLVYWFVGNVFIYSWAAEKMPWLMIHMTMPLMILGAIGLEPVVLGVFGLIQNWVARPTATQGAVGTLEHDSTPPGLPGSRKGVLARGTAIAGGILAVLLLLPTLQNMFQVSYVHAADGPHEMMIYVQTTTDVNIVMAKIDALDQKLNGGKHTLAIGVTDDATWPFAWYLRDYTNVCFQFPSGCKATANSIPIIVTGGDSLATFAGQYEANYDSHVYNMRSWWDEAYKPAPCMITPTNACLNQQTYGGVGPLLWLSYGDNPPPHATFNVGLAARNIWQWWWQRKPFGATDGAYKMGLFIHKGLGVNP
jgi:uncharacterized protein (TIGR03663 family)